MHSKVRLGVDIGGTFTDFALIDGDGRATIHKRLTTPADPSLAVLEGAVAVAGDAGVAVADIAEIVHGTTLVTNALIERRGGRVGMLVTEGFRDTFDIGQEQRYDLYDLRLQFAEPLVPRALRIEIAERLAHDGRVLRPLDPAEVERAAAELVENRQVEALAVCYLHAYADPAHEERTREIVERLFPGLYVSTSADVFRQARELERWTTTCVNAYAQPLVDAYLRRLESGLAGLGFRGHLSIIASGGGLATPEIARRYPVRLLESGPAAGVLMAARIGRALGIDDLLSFDLGGTTAKGALVRRGKPYKKYSFEAAHTYKHRSGSGLQLRIPVIDMAEIGSGGGSIVSVDDLGRLRVGPRSAGAEPGPACYGRGGAEPTLTDANLTLGYLDSGFFLGGRMKLDPAAAADAIETRTASLDLGRLRAAWGIHDIANEDIGRAFRVHATERGFDYRRSAMVASGGGGPIHAARIARKLKVPQVVFPAGAGVMSAFGMLVGAMSFESLRSGRFDLAGLDAAAFEAVMGPVEAEAVGFLLQAGIDRGRIEVDRRLDMRYRGQGYDIEVRLPDDLPAEALLPRLPELFAQAYRTVFETTLDQPLEIVGWKAEARGPEPAFAPEAGRRAAPAGPGGGLKGARRAYFPSVGGLVDCPVYDRYRLAVGETVVGPCLVEERESTVLLDDGDCGRVDAAGNIVAEIAS